MYSPVFDYLFEHNDFKEMVNKIEFNNRNCDFGKDPSENLMFACDLYCLGRFMEAGYYNLYYDPDDDFDKIKNGLIESYARFELNGLHPDNRDYHRQLSINLSHHKHMMGKDTKYVRQHLYDDVFKRAISEKSKIEQFLIDDMQKKVGEYSVFNHMESVYNTPVYICGYMENGSFNIVDHHLFEDRDMAVKNVMDIASEGVSKGESFNGSVFEPYVQDEDGHRIIPLGKIPVITTHLNDMTSRDYEVHLMNGYYGNDFVKTVENADRQYNELSSMKKMVDHMHRNFQGGEDPHSKIIIREDMLTNAPVANTYVERAFEEAFES